MWLRWPPTLNIGVIILIRKGGDNDNKHNINDNAFYPFKVLWQFIGRGTSSPLKFCSWLVYFSQNPGLKKEKGRYWPPWSTQRQEDSPRGQADLSSALCFWGAAATAHKQSGKQLPAPADHCQLCRGRRMSLPLSAVTAVQSRPSAPETPAASGEARVTNSQTKSCFRGRIWF